MNLKKTGRTYWVIAAVAMLAMVLQGCGGDDSNGISQDQQAMLDELAALKAVDLPGGMMLTPATLAALAARADISQDDYDALAAALGDMPLNVATLEALVAHADITPEAVQALRDALQTAQDDLKTAQDELARIEQETADAAAEAAKEDRIARAGQILAAITAETIEAKTLPDGTGADVAAVVATRDAAGMITIDVNGNSDDDYAGGAATAGSGDWNSVTMTKDDADDSTDTLVISTDIAAPTATAISDHADYSNGALSITIAAGDRHQEVIGLDDPPTGSQAIAYDQNDEFDGTWNGIPGTYTCTLSSGCGVSLNGAGDAIFDASDTLSFDPDSSSATHDVPDDAYVYFGWWLNQPEANDAAHDVDVFAGSTTGHAANVTNAMSGTATYTGSAAGQYATRSLTAGVQSDAAHGAFTATASLTANFAGDVAPGTIEGSVTGFELDDGSSPSWSVTFEEAALTNANAEFDGTTEVNFGGGITDADIGAWQGSFYDAADATNGKPGTVAGTFDAETPNASVIGAFGATKE